MVFAAAFFLNKENLGFVLQRNMKYILCNEIAIISFAASEFFNLIEMK